MQRKYAKAFLVSQLRLGYNLAVQVGYCSPKRTHPLTTTQLLSLSNPLLLNILLFSLDHFTIQSTHSDFTSLSIQVVVEDVVMVLNGLDGAVQWWYDI